MNIYQYEFQKDSLTVKFDKVTEKYSIVITVVKVYMSCNN